MPICLPLIQDIVAHLGFADRIQYIAVTLAVNCLLESLDGQAEIDLIRGDILTDRRQVCRLNAIQKYQKRQDLIICPALAGAEHRIPECTGGEIRRNPWHKAILFFFQVIAVHDRIQTSGRACQHAGAAGRGDGDQPAIANAFFFYLLPKPLPLRSVIAPFFKILPGLQSPDETRIPTRFRSSPACGDSSGTF